MYSAILISDSDLQKSERATHKLNLCSAILVSGFYLLKKWESNSLPDWMFSHPHQLFWSTQKIEESNLLPGDTFLLVDLICSNTDERLTSWKIV